MMDNMPMRGYLRGHLRRSGWVHLALVGLILAGWGGSLAAILVGGTAGTFTVASCSSAAVPDLPLVAWDCDGTFASKDGTPRRDDVWITVSRNDSPAVGDRVDVVVGAEWWRPEHGIVPADEIAGSVFGLVLMVGGGLIFFYVVRRGLDELPPRRQLGGLARFLAELPLLLAPPALVTAAIAAPVALGWPTAGYWRTVALIVYLTSVGTMPFLAVLNEMFRD
jgi:hypothetical protein